MSARYHVLIADELMDSKPPWPSFLRPVEASALSHEPGMRWWLFEDDEAAAELEDKKVELWFEARYDDDGRKLPAALIDRQVTAWAP